MEVCTAYFVDERGWPRKNATAVIGAGCFLLAVPSALAFGAVSGLSEGGWFTWDFLTLNNNIWGNYSLSIGAFLICVCAAWKWGVPRLLEALEGVAPRYPLPMRGVLTFMIKFICPVAVLLVLIFIVVTGEYF